MNGEDWEALVGALRTGEPWPGAPPPEVIADRLLPAVEAVARRKAAEELRAAADRLAHANAPDWVCVRLDNRADALTDHEEAGPQPGEPT